MATRSNYDDALRGGVEYQLDSYTSLGGRTGIWHPLNTIRGYFSP